MRSAAYHVGILGHSTEGAALCWSELARHSAVLGHTTHPDLTMDCISFQHVMEAWEAGDHESVRAVLEVSANRVAGAGARFFVCPDNTAHLALEACGRYLPLPGLHIVEVVAEQAKRLGLRRVAIFGTRYTMAGPLYPRELHRMGIEAVIPGEQDREVINELIFDELVHGQVTDHAKRAFHDVAERMRREHRCDAVAAVCTEVPLALTSATSPVPVLDSTRLLAQAAAEVAHGKRPLPTWFGGRFR